MLRIKAEGDTQASWRKNLALEPGKYRFEAKVKAQGIEAAEGQSGKGLGVRISGGTRTGQNAIAGNTGWETVAFQFDAPGGDIVLVAELRATKGEAWFDRPSLKLTRLADPGR